MQRELVQEPEVPGKQEQVLAEPEPKVLLPEQRVPQARWGQSREPEQ